MKVEQRGWTPEDGWSAPLPPCDGPQTLVLVFGSRDLDTEAPLGDLARAFPTSAVIGCSSSGEIFRDAVVDASLSVAICAFDRTTVRATWAAVAEGDDGSAVGRALGSTLAAHPGLRSVLTLSDGLRINGTALATGLSATTPEAVPVTGGLAGDADRFETTWVLADGARREGAVAAIGLYGDALRITTSSMGGWDPFGPERVVTKSHDNILEALDGRPALELYKEYLGDRAEGLPATALLFPLSIRVDGRAPLVRTILAVDEATQSMTFAGDVPQGASVQLMRAHLERLIDGAGRAGERALEGLDPQAPTLVVAISCVGRRLVLGERVDEEVEACLEALPAGSAMVGFYSYGELSPPQGGRCELHNQTMTLTAWQEAP